MWGISRKSKLCYELTKLKLVITLHGKSTMSIVKQDLLDHVLAGQNPKFRFQMRQTTAKTERQSYKIIVPDEGLEKVP